MPNNVNVGTTTNYVSLMDPLFEKFNISEKVFKQYGDQFSAAYRMVRKMGAFKPVDQVKFYHFEDTRIEETIVAGQTVTAAGPGDPLVFQLDAVSVGPNGESFARKFFSLLFPGFKEGVITDVVVGVGPTVTLTVVPKDGTVTLGVTAGQELAVSAPSFGEGTFQPKGITPKLVRRDFTVQILKEAFESSGDADTNAAVVNIKELAQSYENPAEFLAAVNAAGLGNSFVYYGRSLVDARHSNQVAKMLYFGEENTNTVTPIVDSDPAALDGTIRSTKGMYHHIQDRGGVINYGIGAFSLADYDAVADYMQSQNVDPLRPLLHLLGNKQQREIENALISSNASTFVKYDKEKADRAIYAGASKAMNMAFSEVTKGNYTFCQVLEPIFYDPTGLGAPGYNTPNLGFIVPMAQGKDAKTRELMDHMTVRYKALGGINRAYKIWNRGIEITNRDVSELELLAELGAQFFGVNQMVVLEGQ